MTTRKYSSRSQQTTLAAGITDTATSCTVVSGTALLGGATVPAGTTFTVVIDPDTALEEIVDVTVVSTNVLTITRGVENAGTGQAHSAGAAVRHMAIGRDFREANLHIEATGGYNDGTGAHTMHGIAAGEGVVVGTDKTQTLTAKTLTAPIITNPSISGAGVDASIIFEGATADAHETTLTVEEPTQDNVITLPNTTGTVVIANAAQTLTNKTMGDALNAGGFKITNLATPTLASDAVRKDFADAQVAAAATSATSAATSATSAAASATTAANSVATIAGYATSSANSATAAATSATSAAASATAAATSATSAAASAVSAASSATAAATSAASAAVSATAAATSATSASASATAAATSATSSAASATASANSATASATSATASASSASAAATSASSAATSASSAATSATSAETAWDQFDDRYLGPKSTAPTVDNDGNPLTSGVIYWNTTDGNMYAYNGSGWVVFTSSGDITGVTAGTGLSGGGTSGAVTVSLDTSSVYVVPSQTGNTGKFLGTDGTTSSWTNSTTGSFGVGEGIGSTSAVLQLGNGRTADGNAYIDLVGDTTYTDFGLRIIRASGANGTASIQYRGTGGLSINAVDAGAVSIATSNSTRMTVSSGGNVGIAATPNAGVSLIIGANTTGQTSYTGVYFNPTISADTTSQYRSVMSVPATAAAAFTLTTLRHFFANGVTVGAGSAVGTQVGYYAEANITGATTNYGFQSTIPASGSANWSFYASGTAPNYFAGRTGIGATLTSGAMAQVVNTTAADIGFIVKGAASQTGDLLQIQNSAASVLVKVDSTGAATFAGAATFNNSIILATATLNYLYFTDAIAFARSGTGERMRIDASGNTTINSIADATTTTAARGGGYMGIPQSAASGSGAYTVVAADAGEHIYTTTTRTVTIPANASVAFPVGTVLSFISGVGATTTIAITSDTMYLAGAGTTGSRTLAAHGMATAVKVASTTWYISGNGLT